MRRKNKKCFWCDRDTPKIVNDYTPCSSCANLITKGCVIIEVQDIPMQIDQPTLVIEKNYPTGTWFVLKDASVHKLFNPESAAKMLENKIAFLDCNMIKGLGLRMEKEHKESIQ